MRKFIVIRPEVWYQAVIVEANDILEAREKVNNGEGEDENGNFHYSASLESIGGIEI